MENRFDRPEKGIQSVFVARTEINDEGWHTGSHLFADPNDAVRHLRACAAKKVWNLRKGNNIIVRHLRESISGVTLNDGAIIIRTPDTIIDMRVFSMPLHSRYNPNEDCSLHGCE